MVEINDGSRGMNNTNSQIRFKTTMLKPSLCDYGYAYLHNKGLITVPNTAAAVAGRAANDTGKKVIFKICAPFTDLHKWNK